MARPKLEKKDRRAAFVRVRMRDDEKRQIRRAAARSGEAFSDWCRRALLAASA